MSCFSDDVRAAVTPMVCILSAAVILLNFCMLDAVRIRALTSLTERRNAFCAGSLLSYFYDTVERDYGLYAIYGEKESEIQNRYTEMLCGEERSFLATLAGADKKYRTLRLLQYEVCNAKLNLERPLDDIGVLQEQIDAIMKYKSTSNLVMGLAEQAEGLIGFSELSGVYAKYITLSNIYDRYKGKLSELHICLNGETNFMLNCVNGFQNVIGIDKAAAEKIKQLIPKEITHTYTEQEAEVLKAAFSLFAMPAQTYAEYNSEAVRIVSELLEIVEDANGDIGEIKEWLSRQEKESSGEASASSEAACRESIRKMTAEIENGISGSRLYEISAQADGNRNRLHDAYAAWSSCEQKLAEDAALSAEDIIETLDLLSDAYSQYTYISFSMKEAEVSEGDMSGYLLSTDANEKMAMLIGENAGMIPAEIYDVLPSVKNTDGFLYYTAMLEDVSSLQTTDEIVKMLQGCGDIGSLLAANAKDSLSAYFVDDYIMSYFHSSGQESGPGRYLKGEIEYIIAGKQNEQENVSDVYIKLLELRVALNTLHVLCDSEKKAFAETVGQSFAAMTGGVGAGVYTAIVIGSWALAESFADLNELENGRSVPLIKKKGDWITSINGKNFGSSYLGADSSGGGSYSPEGEITKASDVFSLDYTDYLRLLLLQIPKRVKLYRIQDVIELNLYKKTNTRIKVSDLYTAIRCETGIVIDTFLFVNSSGKRKYSAEAESYAEM